jgi:hypothetical protein
VIEWASGVDLDPEFVYAKCRGLKNAQHAIRGDANNLLSLYEKPYARPSIYRYKKSNFGRLRKMFAVKACKSARNEAQYSEKEG